MKLKMTIHKIKCVDDLTIELPLDKGLYAITGQNGSGKSTIVACASSVFYNLYMNEHFGKTASDASISFDFGGTTCVWKKDSNNRWQKKTSGKVNIKGFFEGSLIFGNRFKDTSFDKLKRLDWLNSSKLIPASEFIRENLGLILQGNKNFYEKLFEINDSYMFQGSLFFYEKDGKRISQFHMSTGENLLISILNSIDIRNKDRDNLNKPCIFLLDEIELALHPSSLKRLVTFLDVISKQYNYAIYFSTHSIELISGIKPDNIFYVERYNDNTVNVKNPCYPAYATKFLYDHSGYDNVILVEDDLARSIINRILRKEKLMNSRLVHVLPCGGYTNVIELADDVVKNNLLGKRASIMIVLDKDVELKAKDFIHDRGLANNIPLNFLPVDSLEKFLLKNLFVEVDHIFYTELNDYVFQQRSLEDIIIEYRSGKQEWENTHTGKQYDKNGKEFYSLLDTELRNRNKDREWLVETVVDFLFTQRPETVQPLVNFLKQKFSA